MNIAEAIQYLYPDARPLIDFEVTDESDGKGPHISKWNILLKNGKKAPMPGLDELTAAYAASQQPTEKDFRTEAQRRILSVFPDWKQRNNLSRMLELYRKGEANWSTGEPGAIPAVGGAMDLVAGVKSVFVITKHCTKDGSPKLVESCSYPLTGCRVIDRIYTDLAVIDITADGFRLVELSPGIEFDEVRERTGAPLLPMHE